MLYLIGDLHGRYDQYLKRVNRKKYSPSVQLGDMDMGTYNYLKLVDPLANRILLGNHEHFPNASKWPHFLGDYGQEELGGVPFFFVRGAHSPDFEDRIIGIDWWPEEQLNLEQRYACWDCWDALPQAPNIMLTHCAPQFLAEYLMARYHPAEEYHASHTDQLLQAMFESKPPAFWYFGHYHKDFECTVRGCTFRCVAPGEVLRVTNSGYESVSPRTH